MKTMYQNLRSTGAWSYPKVEKMFEDHQSKWPEAIFNEDSWYKYLAPLVEKGSAAYISMLQGSKAEQRKWWMYNRFRYLDSKYNAGDAQTDVITLRGYAKANITVTPYADIYATIKYGSYLVQTRATRNNSYTLINPLDNVNDTEVYAYSASQLASIGDISGLKVGYAEFSHATRLQDLKIGDSSPSYSNGNLTELYLGNNVLLKTIDVRNCPNLAQAVDLSGCTNIEEVYFDGTAITGLSLPVGGFLKKLHVPATMANLAIRNHKSLTELVMPSYSNLSSLRLENIGTTVNSKAILMALSANARVRLIGFYWEAANAAEIDAIFDQFDAMRGLDEYGNNTEKAQLSGTIHTASLTGAQIAGYNARYQDVRVIADHTTSYLTFASHDGTDTITTVECYDGVPQGDAPAGPSRASTAQYDYTFVGWSKSMDAETPDADALVDVLADRTVYAAYSRTLRTYTVTWKNYDNTVLEADADAPYGTTPTYDGATPTYDGMTSTGWTPEIAAVTGDAVYTATYAIMHTVTFVRAAEDGGNTLATVQVQDGSTPVYSGATPTTTRGSASDFEFIGWTPALGPVSAATTYTAVFADRRSVVIKYLEGTLEEYESQTNDTVREQGLFGGTSSPASRSLKSVAAPFENIGSQAFAYNNELTKVDLTGTDPVSIGTIVFSGSSKVEQLVIRSNSVATLASNGINGSAIEKGFGAVFVPDALVSQYEASSSWNKYRIMPISMYPTTDYSIIRDSWAEILAAESDGTYLSKYHVGDTKLLTIGDDTYYMQIAAFDADTLSDNSGTAKITWISMEAVEEYVNMNDTSPVSGDYPASRLASHLETDLYGDIDATVRAAIKEVSKTYVDSAGATSSFDSRVWIPSVRETNISGSYESSGPVYSGLFTSLDKRKRQRHSERGSQYAVAWWLRTMRGTSANKMSLEGVLATNGASVTTTACVVIGFCT